MCIRSREIRKSAFLYFFLVGIQSTLIAAPNRGQVPSRGHVRIGGLLQAATQDTFEYDNRDLIKDSEHDYHALQIQYGVTDAFYVSLRRGTASWKPNPDSVETFDDGVVWGGGIGVMVPLYQAPRDAITVDVGWDFHYDSERFDAMESRTGTRFDGEATWWQTGITFYGGYQIYHAFAGLRYSQLDLTYTHDSARGRRRGGIQEHDPWGGIIGGGVCWPNGVVLQTEVFVGNRSGYALALMYDFALPEEWLR